jgi:hypothetical protein
MGWAQSVPHHAGRRCRQEALSGLVYGGGYSKACFQLDSMAFSMAFISDSISLI